MCGCGNPNLGALQSMSESELQSRVIAKAQALGWRVKSENQGSRNGSAYRPGTVRNRTANGFPDLVLARDGVALYLECKAEAGKLSGEQAEWQLHLPNMEVIRPSDLARGRVDELLA